MLFFSRYGYGAQAASHLRDHFGNVSVRNVGSVGGNLWMRHAHPDFASDLYVVLEALGARVGVRGADSAETEVYDLGQWLGVDMEKKVILFVYLPALTSQHVFM